MNLVEVPIKSSAEIKGGMVLVYDAAPEKRWLIRGNHRHSYVIDYKGQKVPVSNERKNKIMMSDFDDPNGVPFLGCFIPNPSDSPGGYKVYLPKNTPTGDTE